MNAKKGTALPLCAAAMLVACTLATAAGCSTGRPLAPGIDLSQDVVIRRTSYGVPHIYADNLRAAGYALGYAQMEDHAPRVIESVLKARGEWALHNDFDGSRLNAAIDADAINRLSYRRAVETWPRLPADTRQFLEGFAAGINRYIELHAGEFAPAIQPDFSPYDAHAKGVVKPSRRAIRDFLEANPEVAGTQFAAGLDNERPDSPVAVASSWRGSDAGSNAWAFAPQRTTSGHAVLLRNPHLSWDAGYYEAHIKVPGQFDFYGDFRVGHALGIIGGFNERLGWATTNNAPDLEDIYSFERVPGRPDHYRLDGKVLPLQRDRVEISFREKGILTRTERSFWSTPQGPVIGRTDDRIFVIKSGGAGEFRTGEQFLRMMQARSLAEWLSAVRLRAKSTSNLTYADADGNIFYTWNASIPARPHRALADSEALPVTQSSQMWQDIVAFDAMPQLLNPPGGYVRNENDPFHFTNLQAVLEPSQFPPYFPEPRLRLRSQHSLELIANDTRLSLEDIVELKHSMRMLLADRVKDDLVAAVAATLPQSEFAAALELLAAWDNRVARDSRGAVLFETWWNRYLETAGAETEGPVAASAGFSVAPEHLFREAWSYDRPLQTPRGLADPQRAAEAFNWAVQETRRVFGHWNVAWGDVHRGRIADSNVAVGGCHGILGCFRTFWFDGESDGTRTVRGGDGWVLAVEFGETPRAYSILAYGESSKADSPHRAEQLAMFANNEMKPVAFSDADVARQLLREYRPGARQGSGGTATGGR